MKRPGQWRVVAAVMGLGVVWTLDAACGGAVVGGGGTGLPLCKGASSQESACIACTNAKCASEVDLLASACAAAFSCLAACNCNDDVCSAACEPYATPDCLADLNMRDTCPACTNECSVSVTVIAPDAGGGPSPECSVETGAICGPDGGLFEGGLDSETDSGFETSTGPDSSVGPEASTGPEASSEASAGPETSTDTGTAGLACGSLADCCGLLPAAEFSSCKAISGSNDESACSAELTDLQAMNECLGGSGGTGSGTGSGSGS